MSMPSKGRLPREDSVSGRVRAAVAVLSEPFTTRQVVEAVRATQPDSALNEGTVMGIIGQLRRAGALVAVRRKIRCPITGLRRNAWRRNPTPRKRPVKNRRSWPEPDVRHWIENYANVERAMRFAFHEPIPGNILPQSKFGRQSTHAVMSAVLATLDYERFESVAPIAWLREMVGESQPAVCGALDILEAAGRIVRYPYAREYRASCYVNTAVSADLHLHAFEQELRKLFTDGKAGELRGTALLIYVTFALVGDFRLDPITVKYPQISRIVGVRPVIVRRYTTRLRNMGLIETQRRGREGLEIRFKRGHATLPDASDVTKTAFLELVAKRAEAHPLVSPGRAESEANAWSCFFAAVVSEGFGRARSFLNRRQLEQVLGNRNEGIRNALGKAVDLDLLTPVERGATKAGTNVIRLRVQDSEDDLLAGSDSVLVLSTIAAWRFGLVRKLGRVAHRTHIAMLLLANLTCDPFVASGGSIERSIGLGRADRSRSIPLLRDHQLVRTEGKRRLASHSLLPPLPNPKNKLWCRIHEAIRVAAPSDRRMAGPADHSVRFCDALARLVRATTLGTNIRRPDLAAFLFVGHLAGFDPDVAVTVSGHSLRQIRVGDGEYVLPRLVAAGFLANGDGRSQSTAKGKRARRIYNLKLPNSLEVPIAASGARRFLAGISQLVESGNLARMVRTDLLLYVFVASKVGFRIGHAVRYTTGAIKKLTGINLSDIGPRLRRLGSYLKAHNEHGKFTSIELLDITRTGGVWCPEVPVVGTRPKPGKKQPGRRQLQQRERGLVIDEQNQAVRWNGNKVKVKTGREFDILKKLHDAGGGLVPYNRLVVTDSVADSVVMLTAPPYLKQPIAELRSALKSAGCPWRIQSVRSAGYRIDDGS